MAKKKKKKRSVEQMHRQIQDAVQALPYAVEDHRKHGRRFKAGLLRFVSGPMLRTVNRVMNATRYRGEEGDKLRQTEKMKRHLQQRQAAMKHFQSELNSLNKKRRTR